MGEKLADRSGQECSCKWASPRVLFAILSATVYERYETIRQHPKINKDSKGSGDI